MEAVSGAELRELLESLRNSLESKIDQSRQELLTKFDESRKECQANTERIREECRKSNQELRDEMRAITEKIDGKCDQNRGELCELVQQKQNEVVKSCDTKFHSVYTITDGLGNRVTDMEQKLVILEGTLNVVGKESQARTVQLSDESANKLQQVIEKQKRLEERIDILAASFSANVRDKAEAAAQLIQIDNRVARLETSCGNEDEENNREVFQNEGYQRQAEGVENSNSRTFQNPANSVGNGSETRHSGNGQSRRIPKIAELRNLITFSGNIDEKLPSVFLQELKDILASYDCYPRDYLEAVQYTLVGPANTWFQMNRSRFQNFESFETALIDTYQNPALVASRLTLLRNERYSQVNFKSVSEFAIDRFQKLKILSPNTPDVEIVATVMCLLPIRFQTALATNLFMNFPEFVASIQRLEAFGSSQHGDNRNYPTRNEHGRNAYHQQRVRTVGWTSDGNRRDRTRDSMPSQRRSERTPENMRVRHEGRRTPDHEDRNRNPSSERRRGFPPSQRGGYRYHDTHEDNFRSRNASGQGQRNAYRRENGLNNDGNERREGENRGDWRQYHIAQASVDNVGNANGNNMVHLN